MIPLKSIGYIVSTLLALPIIVLCGHILVGFLSFYENLNYFMSANFLQAMLHSIVLSSISSFISLLLGFIVSLGFYTLHTKRLKLFFILLLMTSFVLQPVILLSVFQEVSFFLNMDAFWQSMIVSIFHLIPLSGLAFIYILSTLNGLAFQNSLSIAPFRHVIKIIIFPQLKQFILALYFLLFILVFIDQAVPSILGYRTYTEDLLAQMTLMENIEQIALSALPSYLLVFVFIILWYQLKQRIFYREQIVSQKGTLRLPLKWLGFLMLGFTNIYLLWIIFGLSLTFFNSDIYTLLQDNIEVVSTSMGFALMTSLLTLCMALTIHHILEKYTHTLFKKLFFNIFLFYLFIPHSLISLVLLDIYQWIGYFSIFTDYLVFFIGYIFILLPIALFLIYILKKLEKEDSFLLFLPVTALNKWIKIILPHMYLKWLLMLFILMVFSLNELSVSILLIPPGFETMIVKIYNLLHYGDKPTIAFLSLVQLFFVILIFSIIGWISKKVYK